jgi:gluconokinase
VIRVESRACTIGVDLGTTNAKAIAFDLSGREVARADAPVELFHDEAGAAEQDPADIYAAATEALARAAAQARDQGYRVERVGISAAMHSLLPLAADETPLGWAMIWMDVRARAEAEALWDSPEGKAVYQRTGTPIHPMAPLVKLIWLRTQRPETFQKAARFVSLKEWIWHHWFGEWRVDASIASATGLYNLRQATWDEGALRLAGIGANQLSPLAPTTYVRRGVREQRLLAAGITADTAFAIGASDGVLANLGVGVIANDRMVLTIGTSLAVRTGATIPVADDASRAFCYVLDTDRFIVGGASNNGGIVLDWLYHKLLSGRLPGEPEGIRLGALIAAAEHVRADDLLFLPYVAAERAPIWQADASGVLLGLRMEHTGVHLMRAAVEGIIFNAYWIASRLFERLGPPRQIVASGKVLGAGWIRQLAADVFGIPVHFQGTADASAEGAATIANIATGLWSWEYAVRRQDQGGTLTRPSGDGDYQRRFQRYRRLATALLTSLSDVYLDGGRP